MNRFSKDIDTTEQLTYYFRGFTNSAFKTVVAFAMVSLESAFILIVIVPMVLVFYLIQRLYLLSSRQIRRIDSTSRSPIYTHFSETVNGIASIRAFGASKQLIDESNKRVDDNHKCFYASFTAERWLTLRLEFIGYCVVLISAIFAVTNRQTLSPGIAGLAISYSMQITSVLARLVRNFTNIETNIVSVERVIEYTETPIEVFNKLLCIYTIAINNTFN